MKARRALRTLAAFVGAAACIAGARAATADPIGGRGERPNIVLLLVDDLGWQDLSVPLHVARTPQNDRFRTPNVEALAARGLRFTNAYASAPVCTPTRTAILTGSSPARSHITYWTLHAGRDTSRAREDLAAPAWRLDGLEEGDVTLPALLSAAGYRTIHVGKAHFGAHGASGADPQRLGFDVNVAGHASGAPASYLGEHAFSAAGKRGEPVGAASVWDVPGLEAYHGEDVFLTEALAREACREVRAALRAGEPFFLNFATYAVHTPIMANRRYLARYEGLDPTEAAYATMVESYDAALGELVALLEEEGALDDTLVIFTSDNGGLSAVARGGPKHMHNAPLRSGKGSAYEGGVRVPTIVAGPGVTATGACSVPIVSHDLFPTILAACGVALPAEHATSVDGRDLGPLLRGEDGFDARRVLGWNQPHQWGAQGPGIEPFTAIRKGDAKLVFFHVGPRFELYDLAEDLGEQHDLAAADPERVRALAAHMERWILERGAQLSIDRATGEEIPRPMTAWRLWKEELER